MDEKRCAKPWLAIILLEKMLRQIAATSRQTQKRLRSAACPERFADIFAQADLLCIALRDSIEHVQSEVDGMTPSPDGSLDRIPRDDRLQQASMGDQSVNNDDALYEQAKQEVCREIAEHSIAEGASSASVRAQSDQPSDGGNSNDHTRCSFSENEVEALVEDRLGCIRPFLKHELRRAVNPDAAIPPAPHSSKLVRDVAAHVRKRDAHVMVSGLDEGGLKKIQRGVRKAHTGKATAAQNCMLAQRFLEAQKTMEQSLYGSTPDYDQLDFIAAYVAEAIQDKIGAYIHCLACSGHPQSSSSFPLDHTHPQGVLAPGTWSKFDPEAATFVPSLQPSEQTVNSGTDSAAQCDATATEDVGTQTVHSCVGGQAAQLTGAIRSDTCVLAETATQTGYGNSGQLPAIRTRWFDLASDDDVPHADAAESISDLGLDQSDPEFPVVSNEATDLKQLIIRCNSLLDTPMQATDLGELAKLRRDIMDYSVQHQDKEEQCRTLMWTLEGL